MEVATVPAISSLYPSVVAAAEVGGAYLAWIGVHTAAANAYTYFCAPSTLSSVFLTPFVTPAPHCRGLLWAVNTGASGIEAMWVSLGTWLGAKVFVRMWK